MNPPRTLTHIRLAILSVLMLVAALMMETDRSVVSTKATPTTHGLPNLKGLPALDYLKEHGIYDRLRASVEASQYELDRAPRGSLPQALGQTSEAYLASNPAQHLQAYFSGEQVLLEPTQGAGEQGWQAGLKLRAYGYGAQMVEVQAGRMRAQGNRVEIPHSPLRIQHSALVEFYVNQPEGIEQGFALTERPGVTFDNEPLRVALVVTGDLQASSEDDAQAVVLSRRDGGQVLRYDHVAATDALGRSLGARMEVGAGEVWLVIDDAQAVYPVTIDPLFSQVKQLTASDGAAFDGFGFSVGISGDTVVVGANAAGNGGAAYIFERNRGGADNWGQVKKLTASDGVGGDLFGESVGISGDTVVVGATNNNLKGAAYVFERNLGGADNWGQVKKLTASDAANDFFGDSVGICGDTVVVGADNKNSQTGAAYIFGRNQGGADNWGQVKKLTAGDAAMGDGFGFSVGINGNAVVVGAFGKNFATGAAYIFGRNQGGADNWGQVKKLTASDAATGDAFAISVGISVDTVVVGAVGKNSFTGAAYIFVRNQGGADNWGQVKKLTASDGAAFDTFGRSVGISGDTVVVGADQLDSGVGNGKAYVYERNTCGADNWGQVQILTASDGAVSASFGKSVGLSGDTVVVGADRGNSFTGAAYTFNNQCNQWAQVREPTASDAAPGDQFGFSVGISGDMLVVGVPFKNSSTGTAYVYGRNQGGADNWGQVKKLTASDGAMNDQFGFSVGISGDTVVVGASDKNSKTGEAYIYGRNQGGADNWGQVKILTASDGAANDQFGFSVGMSGDTVVVGAFGKNSNTGEAYIYGRNQGGTDNWGQVKILTASDGAANDFFGISVGISGDTVVVGADAKNSKTGAAYIFGRNQGGADNWGQVKILTATGGAAGDRFGSSVGISGDTVVVGAFLKNISKTGAAYIYARNQGGADNWGQVQKLTASDDVANDRFGFSVGISGDTVVVGAPGKNSNTGAAHIFTTFCPPPITCPGNITAAAAATCPTSSSAPVNFTVTVSSLCVTVVCKNQDNQVVTSGQPFPVGTTTVTCTATDTLGNTATCSFTVTVFSFCLQDDSNPGNVVLVNAQTGDFSVCCGGVPIASGRGTLTTHGCIGSIDATKGDRQVHIQWDTAANSNKGEGTAYVQKLSNKTICQITDKNMSNNTCQCGNSPPMANPKKPPKERTF